MKLYKYFIIGIALVYIMMICLIYTYGEAAVGWNYLSATMWWGIIGGVIVYSTKQLEEENIKLSITSASSMVEKYEKSERICNACVLEGGKMKCDNYKNIDIVITKCDNSKNPEGKL